MPDREDLTLLTELAHEAGEIAMRHFRKNPQRWEKAGGHGPVTEADLEVNAHILARLAAARPGYAIMSEESPDTAERVIASELVILDPIDGTRAFVEGTSAFAHALAVVRRGVVHVGVVFLPALNKLYAAVRGGGARLNGQPIHANAAACLPGAEVLATRPTLAPENWPGEVPDVTRVYRPSLAYRLCLVAEGRFDAMVTLRDAWEWDTAAGALIVEEAGGVVSDASGAALRFNSAGRQHRGCIAAPAPLHAALLAHRTAA